MKAGDRVPNEYWDNRKDPKWGNLRTEKKKDGLWYFKEAANSKKTEPAYLEDYETVKERKARFYKDYPDGRIIVENLSTDPLTYAFFKTTIFKNAENQSNRLPWSTGHALEVREMELKISNKGEDYAPVNFTSWHENAEESSVGRALDQAGYAGGGKCSREEMERVEKVQKHIPNFFEDLSGIEEAPF